MTDEQKRLIDLLVGKYEVIPEEVLDAVGITQEELEVYLESDS